MGGRGLVAENSFFESGFFEPFGVKRFRESFESIFCCPFNLNLNQVIAAYATQPELKRNRLVQADQDTVKPVLS